MAFLWPWIVAALVVVILYMSGIVRVQVELPKPGTWGDGHIDVIGADPCKLTDGTTGKRGTRDSKAFCFRV